MLRGGRLFAAFSAAIEAADGVLIKTMGDGCLASFGSAADAVTAAVALQQAVAGLRERKVPGLGLRVGVAVGDVTEEDGDVFGPAVVIASRLCSAAVNIRSWPPTWCGCWPGTVAVITMRRPAS